MKRVLITGASRGIGAAISRDLSACGYDVVLNARSMSSELKAICNELNAKSLVFDVSNTKAAREAISDDIDKNGAYYAVILNAGITRDNTFVAFDNNDWFDVINTNLNSFYNVLNPSLMPMIRARKPGRVIVISSVSGIIGNRGQSNYSASKAGLIGAAKSLAIELASRNITVNCVAPGLIQTAMTHDIAHIDEALKLIPAKRVGKPEDVCGIVEFLLSDRAAYITKQVIGVNGGLC